MDPGRKILNLRCDRKISQQDLAKACSITPSALSKIEAGINSPRANIIWRIAQNLGVSIEFLLDEKIPYPYVASRYRQDLYKSNADPTSTVQKDITLEEDKFLDALRSLHPTSREVCLSIPQASLEEIRLIHFILNHQTVENPDPTFRRQFESLVTGGESEEEVPPVTRRKTKKRAVRRSARKTSAKRTPRAKSPTKSARGRKKKAKKKKSSSRR